MKRCVYSLSTSWNSHGHEDGISLVEEIKSLGFDTVELGFALTRRVVDDIASLKEMGEIEISGLHNMCPIPDGMSPDEATPDYYSLASTEEAERKRAIEAARSTIRRARDLAAPAVILHAGRVEMKDRTRDLAAATAYEERFREIKVAMVREREEKAPPHLESVIKSLSVLVPEAASSGVKLALETRYYHREIPSLEEFSLLFNAFVEGTLYYWHDTGHAEVHERLGFCRHADFLEKFRARLLGVHLHDIIGEVRDHLPPGSGTFDFGVLGKYIGDDTIKVIEAHRPSSGEDIVKSVEYLSRVLG